jgi:hypothetical protein
MKQILWKTYSAIFAGLTVLSILTALSLRENIAWVEYILRVTVVSIAVFGLFGFAWKKPFGKPWFWKFVFWGLAATLAWVLLRSDDASGLRQVCSGFWCDAANVLVGAAFVGPLFWGLFSYAYRLPEVWRKREK